MRLRLLVRRRGHGGDPSRLRLQRRRRRRLALAGLVVAAAAGADGARPAPRSPFALAALVHGGVAPHRVPCHPLGPCTCKGEKE